jgi:hypothetical protein
LLDDEQRGWEVFAATVARVDPSRRDEPTVTPDGWSLKDTLFHVDWWLSECGRVLERMADGSWDPEAEEPETPEYVERMNRTRFEAMRSGSWALAESSLTASRERARRTFAALERPTSEAWAWLEEAGATHYAKHVHDITAWLAGSPSDPEVGDLLKEEAESWVALLEATDSIPADRVDLPVATAWGWSTNDVLHHLMAWLDIAAADVQANRGWSHGQERYDEMVDSMNERFVLEGRTKEAERIRGGLARARARARGALSGQAGPSPEAKGWFRTNATEHYAEHVEQLRAMATDA